MYTAGAGMNQGKSAVLGNHFPGTRIPEVLWVFLELLSSVLIRKENKSDSEFMGISHSLFYNLLLFLLGVGRNG